MHDNKRVRRTNESNIKNVRRWIKSGKIKAIKVGVRWLILTKGSKKKRKVVIYARVSTYGQKKDFGESDKDLRGAF